MASLEQHGRRQSRRISFRRPEAQPDSEDRHSVLPRHCQLPIFAILHVDD
jgi:hypothetical protein